ncbi:MAG: leucine-rich repeat domain-containing protein [Mariniblastus sp.]|nr:leucine-rich repeat domain-containing protein [Mariniblastus sp.]
MRVLSLFLVVSLLVVSNSGCNQSDEKKQVENMPRTSSAGSRGNTSLAAKDSDGQEGGLVSVSLRDKATTLGKLAESNSAENLKEIDAHSAGLTEADMAYFTHFPNLEKLTLNVNLKITDESLESLQGLSELENLTLFFCPQLTGSGFEYLTGLDTLVNLNIGNNKNIIDEHLIHLQKLDNLQILLASSLHGITDDGVKHLARISSLRRLRVSGNQITDVGLQQLASLTNLEVLTLARNQHSDDAIAKLQQALPGCKIQY